MRMFDRLTPNYYVGEMYIEPIDGNEHKGQMNANDFQYIIESLYNTPVLTQPLMLKLRNHHVEFEPNEDVPHGTLRISDETFEEVGYSMLPASKEVLVPTAKCVKVFRQMGFFPS